jgi:very-short-patch-repair endonuclease
MPPRKTPADYHALAEKRGFRWLGPEVPNNKAKTGWQCGEGHRWEARYNDILTGSGCPFCAGKAPKVPTDYHALAEKRGFRWTGPEVPNNRTKTGWECEQGHQWEATYSNIHRGTGCPHCAGLAPKAPAHYRALAEQRGFRWLGPEVPNIDTKTWWKCEEGHRWEARYHDIDRGTGCPSCAGVIPKTPEDYHALAERRGFRWLGPEALNIHSKTSWECEEGHRWQARYHDIQQGRGCPVCADRVPKTPADYHSLAEERGFLWLGPEALDTKGNTWWECEEGHRWETDYNHIQRGRGCPFCAGLAPRTPADYHALAEERDFRWLGPEVPNIHTRTAWECAEGHQWEAVYNSIRRGTGCPVCLDLVHGTQVSQVQRDLCEMVAGELNRPFERYNIDVALERSGVPIAVEYDSWYWHAGREEDDAQRDERMIAAGWRVLRVRSNAQLPTRQQLDEAIDCLLEGESQLEIVLDDWGVGPTKFDID